MTSPEQWIRQTVGDTSLRKVASEAGISQATLARQIREGTLTAESVVKIARAYGVSVADGLQAIGVLTEDDVLPTSVEKALREASDEQLADEVLRRMKAGSEIYDRPISEVSNVHTLKPRVPDITLEDLEGLDYVSNTDDDPDPEDDHAWDI
ncbi:helix-turn-helix domain-containing protein [Rhodococcus aetherivorans]|uniref:helix-turn-helix domain-containing protein n=1 Tax=Rhodococcus aetherivorans TaxID=191292 RepID=UPI00388DA47D